MSTSQATTAPQFCPLFVELPTELQVRILEHAASADLTPSTLSAKPLTVRTTLSMSFRTAELLEGKHGGWYEHPVCDIFNAMYQEGFKTHIYLMGTSRVALEAWVRDIWEGEHEDEEMGQMKETVMRYFEEMLEKMKKRMEGRRSDEEGDRGTDVGTLLLDAQIKGS